MAFSQKAGSWFVSWGKVGVATLPQKATMNKTVGHVFYASLNLRPRPPVISTRVTLLWWR